MATGPLRSTLPRPLFSHQTIGGSSPAHPGTPQTQASPVEHAKSPRYLPLTRLPLGRGLWSRSQWQAIAPSVEAARAAVIEVQATVAGSAQRIDVTLSQYEQIRALHQLDEDGLRFVIFAYIGDLLGGNVVHFKTSYLSDSKKERRKIYVNNGNTRPTEGWSLKSHLQAYLCKVATRVSARGQEGGQPSAKLSLQDALAYFGTPTEFFREAIWRPYAKWRGTEHVWEAFGGVHASHVTTQFLMLLQDHPKYFERHMNALQAIAEEPQAPALRERYWQSANSGAYTRGRWYCLRGGLGRDRRLIYWVHPRTKEKYIAFIGQLAEYNIRLRDQAWMQLFVEAIMGQAQ